MTLMNKLTLLSRTRGTNVIDEVHNDDILSWLSDFSAQSNFLALDSKVTSFVTHLSKRLMKDKRFTSIAELVALGFWLRESHLQRKIALTGVVTDAVEPIGTVSHFTPANVDTMFVYSWVASMLMGNKNIIRVASHDSMSKRLLLELINELYALEEYAELAQRNVFVSYDKASDLSAWISAESDARLMWGGDTSVALIKQNTAKETCRDFEFADKYSIAIVHQSELDKDALDPEFPLAKALWRDTQAFQQQACSSPRILFIAEGALLAEGSTKASKEESRAVLFSRLDRLAREAGGEWAQNNRVNEHLVTLQSIAAQTPACGPIQAQVVSDEDPLDAKLLQLSTISVIQVNALSSALIEAHSGNGLFYIQEISSLPAVANELLNTTVSKLQTIGISTGMYNEKQTLIDSLSERVSHPRYRIQPLGQALDFSFVWDGYNLLEGLSVCKSK